RPPKARSHPACREKRPAATNDRSRTRRRSHRAAPPPLARAASPAKCRRTLRAVRGRRPRRLASEFDDNVPTMHDRDQASLLAEIAHAAMIDRGLLPDFSPEARQQVAQLVAADAKPDTAIRDMRKLLWCSIDNDDSRDLDQLTVAEDLGGGNVRILIAIADVDSLVKKGTPIDDHARTNTTSVYTAARIFPMLPEELSTDRTSLNEDVDRYSMVIE